MENEPVAKLTQDNAQSKAGSAGGNPWWWCDSKEKSRLLTCPTSVIALPVLNSERRHSNERP